ncbi:DUF488 domain-containing protein [Estrella lausannensis]|nr:DUF488 domain-containing protein [Estrella lausannensis]
MKSKSSAKMGKLKIKRAYDPPSVDDGVRILVDGLWPRGKTKEEMQLDLWLKSVAPSLDLRKWFSHDPEKWAEFQRKYLSELEANREELNPIVDALKMGAVTLVYGARDQEHNNALCLKQFLERYYHLKSN